MKNLKTAEKVRKEAIDIVGRRTVNRVVKCNRCDDKTNSADGGNCFFCGKILCWDCFEQFGQCGHEKREEDD